MHALRTSPHVTVRNTAPFTSFSCAYKILGHSLNAVKLEQISSLPSRECLSGEFKLILIYFPTGSSKHGKKVKAGKKGVKKSHKHYAKHGKKQEKGKKGHHYKDYKNKKKGAHESSGHKGHKHASKKKSHKSQSKKGGKHHKGAHKMKKAKFKKQGAKKKYHKKKVIMFI